MVKETQAPLFRVGWGQADITPTREVQLRGQFYERISEYVNDPLTATALAVEGTDPSGAADSFIMVSCDLTGVSAQVQQRVRDGLAAALSDFDPRKMFMSATHTHTAPYIGAISGVGRVDPEYCTNPVETKATAETMQPEEYQDLLVEGVVAACVQAWNSRAEGGISSALGRAVVGHNRRTVYSDSAKMYGRTDTIEFDTLEGPSDSGVEMLFIWDSQQQLTGVVLNVACPSQVVEHKCFVSADYWHEVREQLRAELGSGLFVLPQCSAAGDQSPRDLVRRGQGEPVMRELEGCVEIGRRLTRAVMECYPAAEETICMAPVVAHSVKDLELPLRQVTQSQVEAARAEYEAVMETITPDEVLTPQKVRALWAPIGVLKRAKQQEEDPFIPVELHAIRLGDVAFATNPFELFIDYGLRMKARTKAAQMFVIQLASDGRGYLPTAKAMGGGSYSAIVASNRVGPEGGKRLVDQTVAAVNSLWETGAD